VVVAGAILAIVLGIVLAAVTAAQRMVAVSQAQASATQEARRGLDEMVRELMRVPTTEITDETGADAWPPDPPGGWTGIRFRYPESVDAGGVPDSWSPYVTYQLDDTQLVRTDTDGGSRVMANGVTSLTFEEGGSASAEIVLVALTTERTSPGGQVLQQPLQMRIRVRNQ
jgi:type II secretory pathway pseudopilin PulG